MARLVPTREAYLQRRTLVFPPGGLPQGWLTENGPQEALLRSFGLVECTESGYSGSSLTRSVRQQCQSDFVNSSAAFVQETSRASIRMDHMELQQGQYLEKLTGIVERVTFHNSENGWSVLRVSPFKDPHRLATVVVHQAQVFAGASVEFQGGWVNHPRFGE